MTDHAGKEAGRAPLLDGPAESGAMETPERACAPPLSAARCRGHSDTLLSKSIKNP